MHGAVCDHTLPRGVLLTVRYESYQVRVNANGTKEPLYTGRCLLLMDCRFRGNDEYGRAPMFAPADARTRSRANGLDIIQEARPSPLRVRKACQKRRLASASSSAGVRAGMLSPFVPFVQGNHTPGSAVEKGCLTSG